MNIDPMQVHRLTFAVSAILRSLPLIVVCGIAIIATLRSKVLPRATVVMSLTGFGFILAEIVVAAVGQYIAIILRGKSEAASLLGFQLATIGLLQVALLTAGLAFIGRAIFVGRRK